MSAFKKIFGRRSGHAEVEAVAEEIAAAGDGGFVRAVPEAARNLANERVAELISPAAVRQARRIQRMIRAPRMIEEVYVRGYDHLPARSEHAPILALSHKKIHDVAAIVELIAARPFDRFHDITLIAQAGLFSAMYAYRDMVPAFCKRGVAGFFLRPPARFFAHRVGGFLRRTFADVNAYPVYREGRDIPHSEADFHDPLFAGPRITGKSYKEFVKFANRETLHSLIQVQQDMDQRNRLFFIMPEGGYRHDGGIAELHDFLGVFAFRKQAPTIFGSLSYDELCPDRMGRIAAFINLHPPTPAPGAKTEVAEFLARGRHEMGERTVLLASHLLACLVYDYQQRGESFSESELADRFDERSAELLAFSRARPAARAHDPGLERPAYRAERVRRFLRFGRRRYFSRAGDGRLRVSPERLARFERSERTVNDIEWNRNHARHWLEAIRRSADR